MRLFNTALALFVVTGSTVAHAAGDVTTASGAPTGQDAEAQASFDAERKSSNSANDPTEPRLTLEYWNYYAPSLNNLNGGAENGLVNHITIGILLGTACSWALLAVDAAAAGAQEATPPPDSQQQAAAQATNSPSPLIGPPIPGPLAIPQPSPKYTFGPLGDIYVDGIGSGIVQWQNNPFPGNRAWQPDLSNGQIFVQKPDGLIQFYAEAGAYSIWVLGSISRAGACTIACWQARQAYFDRRVTMTWYCAGMTSSRCEQSSPITCEGGLPTERLVAQIVVAKYADHCPLYRQAQILARHHIAIDRAALAFWVGYAAAELKPLWRLLREQILVLRR